MLQCQHELVNVRMALSLQWSSAGYAVLDVENKPPGQLGGHQHRLGVGKKPLDVPVGVNAAVGPGIGIGRAGEPEVDALRR